MTARATARVEVAGGGLVYIDGMALPQIAWKQGAVEPLYIEFSAWAELAGQFAKHLLDSTNQIQATIHSGY